MSDPKGSCHVTVVLLCMGRGGDPHAYRPNRDESQWWSRRDALVRCVASFLFGPSSPPLTGSSSKDMILLFDDDWAQMHLSCDNVGNTVPTEQTILTVFKKAAQSLGTQICQSGLKCRIVLDPTLSSSVNNSNNNNSNMVLPNGLDSKRQVLEYLQAKCSMEFLRTHGLNSNPAVILRKTNKKALMEVWDKWRRHNSSCNGGSSSKASSASDSSANIIESLYSGIVEQFQQQGSDVGTSTIVGTLHETCDEFPCFQPKNDTMDKSSENVHALFFLGAVRDMTTQENRILENVCQRLSVPLVGIRFGTVAEFTSKILSVLAFHHSRQTIWRCAMKRLLVSNQEEYKSAKTTTSGSSRRQATCLHVICTVPLDSSVISSELGQRSRIHWSVVRVVVCTLWRSKLASSTSKQGHINTLTFVFDDGVVLRLSEETFVSKLASQHQAAPSEHQILAALCACLNNQQPSTTARNDDWNKKSLAREVLQQIVHSSSVPVTATISISTGGSNQLSTNFYMADDTAKDHKSIVALLDIQKTTGSSDKMNPRKDRKIQRAFLGASEKMKIATCVESPVSNGVDYDAASITCLQHFLYHNRLFLDQSNATTSGKKRKSLD